MIALLLAATVVPMMSDVPVAGCYLAHEFPNYHDESMILDQAGKQCVTGTMKVERNRNGAMIGLSFLYDEAGAPTRVSFNFCLEGSDGKATPVK